MGAREGVFRDGFAAKGFKLSMVYNGSILEVLITKINFEDFVQQKFNNIYKLKIFIVKMSLYIYIRFCEHKTITFSRTNYNLLILCW